MPGQNDIGPWGSGVNETYTEPPLGDSGGGTYSWFKDCTSPTSGDGTKFMAQWANRMMKQIRRACDGMGITRDETDGDRLLKAIQKADKGIENIGGEVELYKALNTETNKHQLRTLEGINGITVALDSSSGDLQDKIVIDGAGLGGGPGGGSAAVLPGFQYLMELTREASQVLNLGAGVVCADDFAVNIELATGMSKNINATWVAGDDNGALDTGVLAANTWYHVFVISKDDATTDWLISLSPTAPTMPTGYIHKRIRGSILLDGSKAIIPFIQKDGLFVWDAPQLDFSDVSETLWPQTVELSVPPGRRHLADTLMRNSTGVEKSLSAFPTDTTGHTASGVLAKGAFLKVLTDTSSQAKFAAYSGAQGYYSVRTISYFDWRI